MDKNNQALEELIQTFKNFWDANSDLNTNNNQLSFKELEIDFNSAETLRKNHILLVFPSFITNQRASIGSTYQKKTNLLFLVRVYTNKNVQNIIHQAFVAKILNFFDTANLVLSFKSADTLITGGGIIREIPNWIISNVSSEYQAYEKKELSDIIALQTESDELILTE